MIPTVADREAARRILGEALGDIVMPLDSVGPGKWEVLGSDGSKVYVVTERPDTVNGGTYYHCNCIAWPFMRGKGQDCRHVAHVKDRNNYDD